MKVGVTCDQVCLIDARERATKDPPFLCGDFSVHRAFVRFCSVLCDEQPGRLNLPLKEITIDSVDRMAGRLKKGQFF